MANETASVVYVTNTRNTLLQRRFLTLANMLIKVGEGNPTTCDSDLRRPCSVLSKSEVRGPIGRTRVLVRHLPRMKILMDHGILPELKYIRPQDISVQPECAGAVSGLNQVPTVTSLMFSFEKFPEPPARFTLLKLICFEKKLSLNVPFAASKVFWW